MRSAVSLLISSLLAFATFARAQEPIRYRVAVTDPGSHFYHVEAQLPATGDTTRVSLPAWSPGNYTIQNYARYVETFQATDPASGRDLDWDKLDPDTWRIVSTGADQVRVGFDYWADTVDLSMSLLRNDFGFFNGTNLFVYPEGTDYEFPAELSFDLPDGWKVATELADGAEPGTYRARDYHELVDNPTFVGHFDIDSVRAGDRWVRLAVYPARFSQGQAKKLALDALSRIATYQQGLFGGAPYDRYTTFLYLATEPLPYFGGLEHAESELDLLPAVAFQHPTFVFPIVYRLLAHEYFHAWNVKRIRPVQMWPYAYDHEQPTPLLWVSEGITDYYAYLTVVRTGLSNERGFWDQVTQSIDAIGGGPTEAVEDASLETWIDPISIDPNFYYDKGALLGLMLDIQIRSATGDRHSLDDVMRTLYQDDYERGKGFTTADFLRYVGEYVDAGWLSNFYQHYVNGRDPLPYQESFAEAGMKFEADTIAEPYFGVSIARRDSEAVVTFVDPGSSAERAGIQPGDILLRIGDVPVGGPDWDTQFRDAYADSIGGSATVAYRRNGTQRSTQATIGSRNRYEYRLQPDRNASEAERRVREGLLTGNTVGG